MVSESTITMIAGEVQKKIDRITKWIPLFVAIVTAIGSILVAYFNFVLPSRQEIERLEQQIQINEDKIEELATHLDLLNRN